MKREAVVPRSKQGGFTLVELAIAIGLIAVLVSGIVLGSKFLGSGAKTTKVVELVEKIQTGATACRLKNGSAFTTGLNLTTLSNMLQDSLCRTTSPDGNGIFPNGIPNPPAPGLTAISVSWNTNGTLTLTLTAEDTTIAQDIQTELVKSYPNATVNNNTITVPIRL